jgi:hypothetical protein
MVQLLMVAHKERRVAPSRRTEVPAPEFIAAKCWRLKRSGLDLSIGKGLGEREVSIRMATCSNEKGRDWPRICSFLLFKSLRAPHGVIDAFHWGKNGLRESDNSRSAVGVCGERKTANTAHVATPLADEV